MCLIAECSVFLVLCPRTSRTFFLFCCPWENRLHSSTFFNFSTYEMWIETNDIDDLCFSSRPFHCLRCSCLLHQTALTIDSVVQIEEKKLWNLRLWNWVGKRRWSEILAAFNSLISHSVISFWFPDIFIRKKKWGKVFIIVLSQLGSKLTRNNPRRNRTRVESKSSIFLTFPLFHYFSSQLALECHSLRGFLIEIYAVRAVIKLRHPSRIFSSVNSFFYLTFGRCSNIIWVLISWSPSHSRPTRLENLSNIREVSDAGRARWPIPSAQKRR